MIPANFEYFRPQSVQEAVALLQQHSDAKVLAGGHSLIPLMKLRLATPKALVDIGRIPGLSGVRVDDGVVTIGALTTHHMIETSDALKHSLPILPEAASMIGDMQVRNKGTLGGSLAHADPAADMPAVMLALDAEVKAAGPKGERTIKARDFFVGLLATALDPGEVLTEIRIPIPQGRFGSAYAKFPHPASRYAIVGVAAVLVLDAGGRMQDVRLAITGAGPKAFRATQVEQKLRNQLPEPSVLEQAVTNIAHPNDLMGDIHASAEYRAHLCSVYARRALETASARAKTA